MSQWRRSKRNPSGEYLLRTRLPPETVVHQTVGIEVMTAESLVTHTERMAAYIYEDLRELTARATSAWPTYEMPPVYTNDPNLFQRLLCLDIERLLRDRHTTDMALFLYDPSPDAEGQITASLSCQLPCRTDG